jgi:DNA-binding NarL/FixJ family response regulator
LLLTLHKSTELLRAGVSAGAIGYVLKSDDENELIGALETVNRGEISLNPRSSAGLFGAAPSVALALTLFKDGKLYASLEERR